LQQAKSKNEAEQEQGRPREEKRKDSTTNIHRRYRHLFRLPARNRSIAYGSAIVLIATLVSRLSLGYSATEIGLFLLMAEFLLLLGIEIDTQVLKRHNKVATFRRLGSLTIITDSIWLVLVLVGFAIELFTHSSTSLISFVILGALFATSFRALILGSVFYERPVQGIPLAFLQPLLLFIPIGFQFRILTLSFFMGNPDPIAAVIGGLIAVVGIELYMLSINKIKISVYRPFELLQAFLDAWAAEDSTNLERFLDATSKELTIESRMLTISSLQQKKAIIVLPGVHPGPFYPIGSSNIPADIFTGLKTEYIVPMIVHSMSDHGLNLPSKSQVERYVLELKNQNESLDSGVTMTSPVSKTLGKATVTGLAFGSTVLVTITQAPYGMEDFPAQVRQQIEDYAGRKNFKNVLVIDTHNSEGEKPSEKECSDAINAARIVIDELSGLKQFQFNAGLTHSSELNEKLEQDIGPAGIGLILLEVAGERFSLVTVDSNNSVLGYREKVFDEFRKLTQSRILELCTSDTHVTAAKTSDAKGYLALGDVTGHQRFSQILEKLYWKASANIGKGSFSSSIVRGKVKTIGSDVLDDFSGLLDSTTSEAKNGARILGTIVLVISIIVALI
jgi:putative membrane protein